MTRQTSDAHDVDGAHDVTATHDPERGGNPRLISAPREDPWPGDRQEVFRLLDEVTTIGSGTDCDVVLDGLAAWHAEVVHDEQDEFVLVRRDSPREETRVHGAPVDRVVLRTGSRIDLGPRTFTFFREEHADHGRPFGGRAGGEIGHQRPQPGDRPTRQWGAPGKEGP